MLQNNTPWIFGAICIALLVLFWFQNRRQAKLSGVFAWIAFLGLVYGTFLGTFLLTEWLGEVTDTRALVRFGPLIALGTMIPVAFLSLGLVMKSKPGEEDDPPPGAGA